MPILKKNHSNGYTQISNELLRNKQLSLKAKGLLCYMLSCDDNWKFSIRGLAANCKEGQSAIVSTLKELENLGYHKKEKIYENGKVKEWVYYISEEPIYLDTENLDVENLDVGNRYTNNTIYNNTIYKENNIEVSKDTSTADAETKPKKKNLYELCLDSIDELFSDKDIKKSLQDYLSVRITLGKLSAKSFQTIILQINDLADTKEEALKIIYTATVRGYMSFYKDSGKSEQYKKPIEVNDGDIIFSRRRE